MAVRRWGLFAQVGFMLMAAWACVLCAGCTPAMPRGFDSPEPAARNEAIVQAARSGDRSTRADLVRMLDSDDATTRLLAITTLEQMEGTTLGYDSTASEPERDRAIDAWKARLAAEKSERAAGAGGTR